MNSSVATSVTFTSHSAADATFQYHRQLRDTGKYVDLDIETAEGKIIKAHRWILETRFPVLRSEFRDNLPRQHLDLSRYPLEAVEAVIDYAYGTQLVVTEDTALKVILLSQNLHCLEVVQWCRDFICQRVNEENFKEVWRIGNLSADDELIRACLPLMVAHISGSIIVPSLLETTEDIGLRSLLSDERSWRLSVTSRISVLAAWVQTASTTEIQQQRINAFNDLLTLIDFEGVSSRELVNIFLDRNVSALPDKLREDLGEKILTSMALPSSSSPFRLNTYLIRNASSGTRMDNAFLALCSDGTTRALVRVTIYPSPRISKLATVVFWNSAYVAYKGGVVGLGLPAKNTFKRIDTVNGEQNSLPSMLFARCDHVCVATEHFLYVLGGRCDLTRARYLSDCERYSWTLCRWEAIPSMRAERSNLAAVRIPGLGILVVGGERDDESLDEVELLRLASDGKYASSWQIMPPMLQKRGNPTACYLGGSVYVCSSDAAKLELERLHIVDGDSGQWTKIECQFEFTDVRWQFLLSMNGSMLSIDEWGGIYKADLIENGQDGTAKCSMTKTSQIEGFSNWNYLYGIFEA